MGANRQDQQNQQQQNQQNQQNNQQQTGQQQTGQESNQQQTGQQQDQQNNQQQQQGDQQQTFDRAYVETLRQEAAQNRTRANEQQQQFEQLRNGLAQALGMGDQNQDPAQLQNQLQQTQQQYRRERLQNAVLTTSLGQNADPGLTWAHLYASGALDNIDITAADFSQQVTSQVQAAVQANAKLAADYSPNTSTGDVGGGSNPPNINQQTAERNPWKKDTFNMTDQGRILNDNPAVAKQMMEAAEVPPHQIKRMLLDAANS